MLAVELGPHACEQGSLPTQCLRLQPLRIENALTKQNCSFLEHRQTFLVIVFTSYEVP